MRRIAILTLVLLLAALPTAAQEPPPQIDLALAQLSAALGRQITRTDLDSYSFEQNVYNDSALGCPLAVGTPLSNPISAYTFDLVYAGVPYDVRVSADGATAFVCEGALINLPTADPNTNCPADFAGYQPPRLRVGGQGRIGIAGTPNRLRDAPSINAAQIGNIEPGTTVDVIGGPSCEDTSQIVWWRVAFDNTIGWTAEGVVGDYFLAPVGAPELSALPDERTLINPAALEALLPLADADIAGAQIVGFGDGGRMLMVAGEEGVVVYDLLDRESIEILGGEGVTAAAISNDGRFVLYATLNNAVYLYDMASGTGDAVVISPDGDVVNALGFSDSGEFFAVGRGDPVQTPVSQPAVELYAFGADAPQLILTDAPVRALAFAPDSPRLAFITDSLYVTEVGGEPQIAATLTQPLDANIGWLNPSVVVFSDTGALRAENLETGISRTFGVPDAAYPTAVTTSPDESLIAALVTLGEDTRLVIFYTETGDLLFEEGYDAAVGLAFSPDGTLIALAGANGVTLLGADPAGLAVG